MESQATTELKARIVTAALDHVPFDGWSDATLCAALSDCDVDTETGRALFPRGAVDLALAFHRQGDADLLRALRNADLSEMRYRDRVAYGVRLRLEAVADHKEAVRRGTTLFALPIHAADGAKAIWETADSIWEGLGDRANDFNWYSKRATLAGVYSATVLYWLGDQSPDHTATLAFLDRRIDDVMQIEKLKKSVNENPALKPLMTGPNWLLGKIRPPARVARIDLPGYIRPKDQQ